MTNTVSNQLNIGAINDLPVAAKTQGVDSNKFKDEFNSRVNESSTKDKKVSKSDKKVEDNDQVVEEVANQVAETLENQDVNGQQLVDLLAELGVLSEEQVASLVQSEVTDGLIVEDHLIENVVELVMSDTETLSKFLENPDLAQFNIEDVNLADFESQIMSQFEVLTDVQSLGTEEVHYEKELGLQTESYDFKLAFLSNQQNADSAPVVEVQNVETIPTPKLVDMNFDPIMTQMASMRSELVDGETHKMVVKLNPESLGKLEIELSMNKGEVTGIINVSNAKAKDMMEDMVNAIKSQLNAQNVNVGSLDVNLNNQGQNSFMNQQEEKEFYQFNSNMRSFHSSENARTVESPVYTSRGYVDTSSSRLNIWV
jgi:flagellar hook-length control protein FliK